MSSIDFYIQILNALEEIGAQPTDIIIGKLQAWDEGRSDKHPNDDHSMLVFDLGGFSDSKIDYEMISKQAAKIGNEASVMWEELVRRTKKEVENRKS